MRAGGRVAITAILLAVTAYGGASSLLADGNRLTSGDAGAQRLALDRFSRMPTWLIAHVGTSAL